MLYVLPILLIIPLLFYLLRKKNRKFRQTATITNRIPVTQTKSRGTRVQIVSERVVNYPLPGFSRVVRERVNVQRNPQDYATEIGWRPAGTNNYIGVYRVGNSTWQGEAFRKGNYFDFYIIDPPDVIYGHNCFVHKGNGRFQVHWHNGNPRTLSEGIMGVEAEIARRMGIYS